MTVKELIEKLKDLPPETPVVFCRYSDYWELKSEITDELSAYGADAPSVITAFQHEDGRWEEFHPEQWKTELPTVAKILVFPGN